MIYVMSLPQVISHACLIWGIVTFSCHITLMGTGACECVFAGWELKATGIPAICCTKLK